MVITFIPKTENELKEANLIAAKTICDFEVLEAKDETSKAGNPMIHLKLKVYKDDGGYIFIDDYLMALMEFKLRHAAEATSNLDKYNKGSLSADDFSGKAGKVKIGIQKSKDPQYADKNTINDYIVSGIQVKAVLNSKEDLQDEVPF